MTNPQTKTTHYPNLVDKIIKREGPKLKPHTDPVGIPTYGPGYAMVVRGSDGRFVRRSKTEIEATVSGAVHGAPGKWTMRDEDYARLGEAAEVLNRADAAGNHDNKRRVAEVRPIVYSMAMPVLNENGQKWIVRQEIRKAEQIVNRNLVDKARTMPVPEGMTRAGLIERAKEISASPAMGGLVSLAYNALPPSKMPKATAHLLSGNRAGAYYEIVYRTNANGQPGHANRRAAEAVDTLGDPKDWSPADRAALARIFRENADVVGRYEARYPDAFRGGRTLGELTAGAGGGTSDGPGAAGGDGPVPGDDAAPDGAPAPADKGADLRPEDGPGTVRHAAARSYSKGREEAEGRAVRDCQDGGRRGADGLASGLAPPLPDRPDRPDFRLPEEFRAIRERLQGPYNLVDLILGKPPADWTEAEMRTVFHDDVYGNRHDPRRERTADGVTEWFRLFRGGRRRPPPARPRPPRSRDGAALEVALGGIGDGLAAIARGRGGIAGAVAQLQDGLNDLAGGGAAKLKTDGDLGPKTRDRLVRALIENGRDEVAGAVALAPFGRYARAADRSGRGGDLARTLAVMAPTAAGGRRSAPGAQDASGPVRALQKTLNEAGDEIFQPGAWRPLAVDGFAGPKTERAFQSALRALGPDRLTARYRRRLGRP